MSFNKEDLVEFFKMVDENPSFVIIDIVNLLKNSGKLSSFDEGQLCNWGLSFRCNNWIWQRTAQEQANICYVEDWV